jgi:hypothetical protein
MAIGTNLGRDLGLRGSRREFVAASAPDVAFFVLRMDAFLHASALSQEYASSMPVPKYFILLEELHRSKSIFQTEPGGNLEDGSARRKAV